VGETGPGHAGVMGLPEQPQASAVALVDLAAEPWAIALSWPRSLMALVQLVTPSPVDAGRASAPLTLRNPCDWGRTQRFLALERMCSSHTPIEGLWAYFNEPRNPRAQTRFTSTRRTNQGMVEKWVCSSSVSP
jgi:hypothetical protein